MSSSKVEQAERQQAIEQVAPTQVVTKQKDRPIPKSLRRGLEPPLIRAPTKKELKRLQKQFKRNIVTRSVCKAFDKNFNDYSFGSGETDVQDIEIFFADVRPYIKQIVSIKLKRYRPTGAGVSFDLVLVTSIRNKAEAVEMDQFFTRSRRHHVLIILR